MSKERISCVGAGVSSLLQLPDLDKYRPEARVLCLHGNNIASLHGIQHLPNLTDLNLSSNQLQSLEGLQMLTALTSINLASNRLQSVAGLQTLTGIQRLLLSHNFITSLSSFLQHTASAASLNHLDLRNNQLSSLDGLSGLSRLSTLRHLLLSGGHPGNAICSLPGFGQRTAQMLPTLETLDGQLARVILAQPYTKQQQHIVQPSALSLHPDGAATDALPPLALPAPPSVLLGAHTGTVPAYHQAQTVNLSAGSSTSNQMALIPARQSSSDTQQESRIAALEARLRDVLSARNRPPLAPTENLLNRAGPLISAQHARKIRPKAVMHEVACQTATDMGHLDKLQRDAVSLKQELQKLADQLEQRTSDALRVEQQAELLAQEAQDQAQRKVCAMSTPCRVFLTKLAANAPLMACQCLQMTTLSEGRIMHIGWSPATIVNKNHLV